MYIKKIKIENFRSINKIELELDKINLFWSSVLNTNVSSCIHICNDRYNSYIRVISVPSDPNIRTTIFKSYVDDTAAWIGYLAKRRDKDNTPYDHNRFGTSQMSYQDKEILKNHLPSIDYITI